MHSVINSWYGIGTVTSNVADNNFIMYVINGNVWQLVRKRRLTLRYFDQKYVSFLKSFALLPSGDQNGQGMIKSW